jgi:hypothetical protein
MGELVSQMCCCLCGDPHMGRTLTEGWFADGQSDKHYRAIKIMCPKCLARMGIKVDSQGGFAPVEKEASDAPAAAK